MVLELTIRNSESKFIRLLQREQACNLLCPVHGSTVLGGTWRRHLELRGGWDKGKPSMKPKVHAGRLQMTS